MPVENPLIRLMLILTLAVSLGATQQQTERGRQTQQKHSPKAAEWREVEEVLRVSGEMEEGHVFRVSFPRADLDIAVKDVRIRPGFALGSWVAFKFFGSRAMAMGDLVLTEDEVLPVMRKLQQNNVHQTALHNHLLHESKDVMYVHIMAEGKPAEIARKVKEALQATKTPLAGRKSRPHSGSNRA